MKEHTVPYSEIQAFYKECYKILDDIENQQLEIDASLKELRKGEKSRPRKSRRIRIPFTEYQTVC